MNRLQHIGIGFVALAVSVATALAAGPTTRRALDAGQGRTFTLALPLESWLVTDGDMTIGNGRSHRLIGRPGGRPMVLELWIDNGFRTPVNETLRGRLGSQPRLYAPSTEPAGAAPPPPPVRPIGNPPAGFYATRRNTDPTTAARYAWASDFAIRADRATLFGRLLHGGDDKAAAVVLDALAGSELSPPPRRSAKRAATTQRSAVRMVADETGDAFVIDLPADQKAETNHFPRIGFGGSRPVGPGIYFSYSTAADPGGDAKAYRDSAWPGLEKGLARQRDPATRPAAFPVPVPFTDSGDARLAIRRVRTDFANAVYAYLVDGDVWVSIRMEGSDDDEDAADMLRIARSARIERGTPTTKPAIRPRPTTRPNARPPLADAPPMSGPPDLGCVTAPDGQSTLVMDLPWTPTPRATGNLPPSMMPPVSFSRRMRCFVEWDFGTFAGPATEARDRDWARRQRVSAAVRPTNDAAPKFTDSGDAKLAIRTVESATGRFVYGYLKHGDEIVLVRLQSMAPEARPGEDDLPTMLRILRTARIEPGVVRSRAATQPATRPAR